MPQQIFGAEAAVSMVNRALANTSPAHTVYLNQVAAAGTTEASQYAFAQQLGAQYAVGKTAAELSTQLLGNLGVSNAVLEAALTDYIAFHGEANIGIIALQLGQILSGLEGDATFGAAAKAWNQEVTNAYQYSSSSNNNTPQTGDDGAGTQKLTRFTDALAAHEFTGYLDYNQFTGKDEQTLTDSDRLTGTDATDDLLFAQLANASTRPTLNGVEIVSIDAKANNVALDLADANGVKTIINTRSNEASALTFSNLKNLVDVVVRATNGNTEVKFNGSVVAGTADALNLTVDGAGVKAAPSKFTANGIETLNITAAGAASVLSEVAVGGNLKTVTITGDQNLTIGTKTGDAVKNAGTPQAETTNGFTGANIETVDASAATGNLFLNLVASAGRDQTVKTGTGADVVVTGKLMATDTFDLGAGNDRLVLAGTGANSNNASQEAAKLIGVEEVETREVGARLNLTNAADVKLLAVADLGTGVVGTSAGFNNVTAVKSGTAVVYEGRGLANGASNSNVAFGTVTYNLVNATGTSDVIDFKFNNAGVALGANSTVTIGDITNTGNNVETMNFAFSDVVASSKVIVNDIGGNAGALKTLTVSSDSKVEFKGVVDLTKLALVDATGVKNGFIAIFGDLADTAAATIKLGGAGANEVTVGSANNTGNAGVTVTTLTVDATAGTGAQKLNVANKDVAAAAAADVDTRAEVVALLNAGNKVGANVLGGSGNDEITVNTISTAISTIKGGAGADKIVLTGAGTDVLVLALGDAGSSVATGDTVTGFTAAAGEQDYLDLRSFGFDLNLQGVKAAASALNGTAGEFYTNPADATTAKAVATYEVGSDLVVAIDANGDGKLGDGDLVVTLVGVAQVDFDANDVIWNS